MIGPTDLLHPSPAPHFKTFQAFLIYIYIYIYICVCVCVCVYIYIHVCVILVASHILWSEEIISELEIFKERLENNVNIYVKVIAFIE